MKNHCAFSKNHSCPLWTDYELTCYELEEQTHYVMATGLKLNVNTCHLNTTPIPRDLNIDHV